MGLPFKALGWGVSLTSIDFLPLGAGTFPCAAFLSFSTVFFLLRFLLVHSCQDFGPKAPCLALVQDDLDVTVGE